MGETETKVFSVRIVSIDYYTAPPIPDLDICYSSFQGGKVNEVPVIRIYGSTPAGQKTCLHIHRALPYLYVPWADLSVQPHDEDETYPHVVSCALEKALKLRGNAGAKRQHVHGCTLVRARKFYGYHFTEDLFLKIYLYYPHDVARAASLLLGGAVLNKSLQPYESHIPFLLQFLIDYNLSGMGHIHISKMKFRHPVPDLFNPRKASNHAKSEQEIINFPSLSTNIQAVSSGDASLHSPVWISSTVSDDWLWQSSGDVDASDLFVHLVKRQSTCELEGDAAVEEILNQQFRLYTSLSQTSMEVKMVQSLIPIWEEEYERTGVHSSTVIPDSGKPLPEDVLKILSYGLEFEDKLTEFSRKTETCFALFEKDGQHVQSMRSSGGGVNSVEHHSIEFSINDGEPLKWSNAKNRVEFISSQVSGEEKYGAVPCEREDENSKVLSVDVELPTDMAGTFTPKGGDEEASGLLRWFASSQAAEDLSSDDDLAHEIILSPLLPATTIEKVLEKAKEDYENESQQECQDILDSVDLDGFEEFKERASSVNHSYSAEKTIPQLDGSGDDQYMSPTRDSLEVKKSESGEPEQYQLHLDAPSILTSKQKRKRALWGSLPFSINNAVQPISFNMTSECGTKVGSCAENVVAKCSDTSSKNIATDFCDSKEAGLLVGCSVRDLMRKKRCHRLDSPECGIRKPEQVLSDLPKECAHISQQQLEFEAAQDCRQGMCPTESPILCPAFTDHQKETLGGPWVDTCMLKLYDKDLALKDGDLHTHERSDDEADMGGTVESGKSMVSRPHVEKYIPSKSFNATSKEPAVSNFNACNDKPDTLVNMQSLKYGNDRYDCKSDDGGNSFLDCAPGRLSKNHGNNIPTYPSVLLVESFASVQQGEDNCLCMSGRSVLKAVETEAEPSEIVCMTLCKKPPKIEWADGLFVDAFQSSTVSSILLRGSGDTVEGTTSVQKKGTDEFLPFFVDRQEKEVKDKSLKRIDSNSRQAVIGVPTHYQNDGSCLYLLAPKFSPPSRDCVSRWLLHDEKGALREDSNSTPQEPSSVNDKEMEQSCNDVKLANQKENDIVNLKKSSDLSQDISQISGPPGKLKPTPVSQMGFRDPASVGGGQQLTLFSVEVQAECRGDLRPDPRFDAITVIALAIQEDNEHIPKIYVILRDNIESYQRNFEGICGCKVLYSSEEKLLLEHFMKIIKSFDPDIIMGWDIQGGSLGFLAERAAHLGIGLLNYISRTPSEIKIPSEDLEICNKVMPDDLPPEPSIADFILSQDALIEDEWGRTHASGIHVGGRAVLNVWRLMRGEIKLNIYTVEAVAQAVLRRKVPLINNRVLMRWYLSGSAPARHRCIEYVMERAKLNLEIINQLDLINRTSELARVFGIDFFSVLSRGSQYRVESMLLRLAHTQNYLAISPGKQQVASQPAMECLPLVMEPESGFYADPVVVLDFQSLYPSMIIAYNLCFCTCLGKLLPSQENTLGVSSFYPDTDVLRNLNKQLLFTPNGVMYVPSKVCKGILPRLLEEILTTRIMVKQAMKKLASSQQVLHRIFNARQLALKLIANVTYGYTAAGFSGRMPCAELADSIVQCGRRTLENAISFVNAHDKWRAKVIYGDTDSMFVLLKGRTVEEAFHIGQDIASSISAMNPYPVTLKMEKVYSACVLLTKKRYVGYSYESPDQKEPIFDAKGIETVRRDTCGAVAKTMEQSLRLLFEHQDLLKVKSYLQRQWTRILAGKVSLQDFVFAKEVRLGTYSARASSLLPPAASVAMKAMRADPRAEPRYGERIPYVVIHGSPGARLVDMVVDPLDLLAIDSPYRLNDVYYINKQIIPALQRVFSLVGGNLNRWFLEMPRPVKESLAKRHFYAPNLHRTRIDYYYLSKCCILCGEFVHSSSHLCDKCSIKEIAVAAALTSRTSKLEKEMQHLVAICRHCGGGDWLVESGVKCTSLACSVFFERRKVQKELQALSAVSTEAGFYPKCMVEWF